MVEKESSPTNVFQTVKQLVKDIEAFTIRITIYGTFISSFEYPPIYIKEGTILKRYQKPLYLKHYFEKAKE